MQKKMLGVWNSINNEQVAASMQSSTAPCVDIEDPGASLRYEWMQDRRDARGRRPGDTNFDPTTLLIPPTVRQACF